ncbi:MAG: molybdopterin-dependent oxidoreductase [Chloroflexi bacterium]|nr:molybdopterin-dependent oxidoreductase [Chloroflexota bacterium]
MAGNITTRSPLKTFLHPQCILATEMNYEPLGRLYGAPLRLRVENQLGYKMVKWIKSIEFVTSEEKIGEGYGGKNEDDEYFDLIPDIWILVESCTTANDVLVRLNDIKTCL